MTLGSMPQDEQVALVAGIAIGAFLSMRLSGTTRQAISSGTLAQRVNAPAMI